MPDTTAPPAQLPVSRPTHGATSDDFRASFTPIPWLAEKWTQPDPTTYVFSLRKDVKWQNTALTQGRALTSADIKWHFDRQAAAKTKDGVDTPFRFSAVYKGIKVETPDATTAKITLPKSLPDPLTGGLHSIFCRL